MIQLGTVTCFSGLWGNQDLTKLEKNAVAAGASLFVFSEYLFSAAENFGDRFDQVGLVAVAPFCTMVLVTTASCYYHSKEEFSDHFRLMFSGLGFPAFWVGAQALSKVAL